MAGCPVRPPHCWNRYAGGRLPQALLTAHWSRGAGGCSPCPLLRWEQVSVPPHPLRITGGVAGGQASAWSRPGRRGHGSQWSQGGHGALTLAATRHVCEGEAVPPREGGRKCGHQEALPGGVVERGVGPKHWRAQMSAVALRVLGALHPCWPPLPPHGAWGLRPGWRGGHSPGNCSSGRG